MGEMVQLREKDGHVLHAYVVQPGVPARGGLVILQEIFGVNAHIRSVADRYADEDGFVVVAPALFDRIEPGVELNDEGEDRQRAMALLAKFDIEKAMDDVAAAVQCERCFGNVKKIGVVGCGLMGAGIAQTAAQAGFQVTVREVSTELLDKGFANIDKSLARLVQRGLEFQMALAQMRHFLGHGALVAAPRE